MHIQKSFALFAEVDYTIPTVGLSLALYALIDKVIVPLVARNNKDAGTTTRTCQQVHNEDIRRRIGETEAEIRDLRKALFEHTTELTVAIAILKRLDID